MDIELCKELSGYIDKLTTSGETQLDKDTMKKLKKICKQSDDYVKYTHDLVLTQLEKHHSEIRLSAFQICDELFNRSHVFRELILAEFQEFMNLTIEADPHFPLPPPKAAANSLKRNALDTIHNWNEKYGSDYKQISLGYNFLKNCKMIDFSGTEIRTHAEQRRSLKQQERHDLMRKQRLENVLKEMAENSLNVKDVLIQIENCLKLLMPDPESFQIHGLMSPNCRPSYHNPFLSYAKRTPVDVSASTTVKKTADVSKIKGTRSSHKGQPPLVKVKEEPTETDCNARCEAESGSGLKVKLEPFSCVESGHGGGVGVESDKCSPVAVEAGTGKGRHTRALRDTSTGQEPSNTEARTGARVAAQNGPIVVKSEPIEENVDGDNGSSDSDNFEELSTPSNSEDEDEIEDEVAEDDVVRNHGLLSQLYRIQVEIRPEDTSIHETDDNTDILHSLKDLVRQVSKKFIPEVQRWLEVLTKTGAEQAQIQKAIDIKNALQHAKKRTGSFRIIPMVKVSTKPTKTEKKVDADDDDDDDDDDFEDVPNKDGYEDDIPAHLREPPKTVKPPTTREWQMPKVPLRCKTRGKVELDPTTPQATLMKLVDEMKAAKAHSLPLIAPKREQAGPSSRGPLPDVPFVPFGTDLLNWGEKQETPLVVKYESSHRFWNTAFDEGSDTVDKAAVESMNKRFINFTGHFEPVKWSCRAPLNNGTLCPRQDRYKCPFHGKIIARDNMGQPVKLEDAQRLAEEDIKRRKDNPAEWEDPDLQAEIEAATGVSLNPAGSKVKGRKRKQSSGLTNIGKARSTSKTRLEKIVLNPAARKRVEENMSSINNRKFLDKFGNNFAYALN